MDRYNEKLENCMPEPELKNPGTEKGDGAGRGANVFRKHFSFVPANIPVPHSEAAINVFIL